MTENQGLSQDDRTMGMLCHLAALVGFLGPLIVWLVKKDTSAFVNDQGKESLNFQISMTLYVFAALALTVLCIGILFLILEFMVLFNLGPFARRERGHGLCARGRRSEHDGFRDGNGCGRDAFASGTSSRTNDFAKHLVAERRDGRLADGQAVLREEFGNRAIRGALLPEFGNHFFGFLGVQ